MIKFEERFLNHVYKTDSGHWIWLGCSCGRYGKFFINNKVDRAHRVSYKIYIGEIPEGLYVLHTCDIPLCVNPQHLFLGDQFDNMRDMSNKGRCNMTDERKYKISIAHKGKKLSEAHKFKISASGKLRWLKHKGD